MPVTRFGGFRPQLGNVDPAAAVDFSTPQAVLDAAGVRSIYDVQSASRYYYELIFSFASLAAGQSVQVKVQQDAGAAFVCDMIVGCAFYTSTVANVGLAGTQLARDPSTTTGATSNLLAPLSQVIVQWWANNNYPAQSGGLWVNRVGTVENPLIPLFKPIIAPGAQITYQITNNTAVTISGEITWIGNNLRMA